MGNVKTVPEFRITRKIARRILKQQVGSKNMSKEWRKRQIKKYGDKIYQFLRKFNLPSKTLHARRHEIIEF